MTTSRRFVALFWDKAVEFWSKRTGLEVQPEVPCLKGTSLQWIEVRSAKIDTHPGDQLSAAVRLVQRELHGIVVS